MTDTYLDEFVLIASSGLLDVAWYRQHYPDVAAAGLDPLEHFIRHGWREQRDPGPCFSVRYYLERYADVRAADLNPLVHYLHQGWREGRQPAPTFDPMQYLATRPELRGLLVCPLVHLVAVHHADGSPLPEAEG
jgi:O-antigen biosynthesis protein